LRNGLAAYHGEHEGLDLMWLDPGLGKEVRWSKMWPGFFLIREVAAGVDDDGKEAQIIVFPEGANERESVPVGEGEIQ